LSTSADSVSYGQEILSGVAAYPEISWRQASTGVATRAEAALPPSLADVAARVSASRDDIATVFVGRY
jgi:hypothetical protein